MDILTDNQVSRLVGLSYDFLEKKGVRVDHERGLKVLSAGGAKVNFETGLVQFTGSLIDRCLQLAPKKILLAGRKPEFDLVLEPSRDKLYVRSNTGARNYLDPHHNHACRLLNKADLAEWAQLLSLLPRINVAAYPTPHDTPAETKDVHGLDALIKYCEKHIYVQPYSVPSLKYLMAMAEAVAGGMDELRNRPFISLISGSFSPFQFKNLDIESLFVASEANLPVHMGILPNAGATSPVTISGTVLLSSIELLAGLVIAQIISPGLPVISNTISLALDMHSGITTQASPRAALAAAATVEFVSRAYGIPTHTWGLGSDSLYHGAQSMAERAVLATLTALSGVHLLGGAGQLESGSAVSPLQLIIDHELVLTIQKAVEDWGDMSEDWLGLESLYHVPHGGHFLEERHTFRFGREIPQSKLFATMHRSTWEESGQQDLLDRAQEEYNRLTKKFAGVLLEPEKARELDKLVAQADKELAGTN